MKGDRILLFWLWINCSVLLFTGQVEINFKFLLQIWPSSACLVWVSSLSLHFFKDKIVQYWNVLAAEALQKIFLLITFGH